ncbi:MAG: 1-phosphofructokinase [Clostridiales bacterium]|nr:1-phosphofructokinase [Clostridiales bacterium]
MVTTVTINPAIDRTLITNNFQVNNVNRVMDSHVSAGGKGINVSKVVKKLGEETTALGFLAGQAGKELLSRLEGYGFPNDFLWIEGVTRTNIKIVDVGNNSCTDFNEKGPIIPDGQLENLKNKIMGYSKNSEILILAGNVQECVSTSIYRDIINQNKGTKIFLDASGELLKKGIEAAPYFIKPNISELSEIVGKDLSDTNELISEAKKLNSKGIELVCVSMGGDGILLSTNDKVLLAKPPKVEVKSTVGAGDSVVASFAVGIYRKQAIEDTLRLACAVSAASVTLESTEAPDESIINDFLKKVEIIQL